MLLPPLQYSVGTIASEVTTSVQLFRSWSHIDMASVLSGWYGYNIFNIANFIEYEPYPKRRKLDKQNAYRGVEAAGDYELTHKDCSRVQGPVIYRPFAADSGQQKSKKEKQKPEVVILPAEESAPSDGETNINHLFPEILCLIFKQLDLQSKGRAAQVNNSSYKKSGRINSLYSLVVPYQTLAPFR